jgi:hypothetical protein
MIERKKQHKDGERWVEEHLPQYTSALAARQAIARELNVSTSTIDFVRVDGAGLLDIKTSVKGCGEYNAYSVLEASAPYRALEAGLTVEYLFLWIKERRIIDVKGPISHRDVWRHASGDHYRRSMRVDLSSFPSRLGE